MKQYLSILLRNQFNLFYRFGYVFVPNSELVEFDGTISEEVKLKLVEKFATTTPFEYDEEYLILHLDIESQSDSDFTQFDIQNIVAVYPLSRQAKASIEFKTDPRISLGDPVFESILPSIEADIQKKEVEKAIAALWSICGFEETLDKYLSEIGVETILRGLEHRRTGTNAAKIQGGSYWEYLIAYDRYDYFPNSQLGYLYDAGQVFAYSRGHSTFEGSSVHKFLERTNSKKPDIKLSDFQKFFETEEMLKGYVSLTTVGDIKQYIIAPLYFMLRDDIRKHEDLHQTSFLKHLDYLKEFGNSFNYVIILLGAFFGFRKFYDLYYNTLNLRFYKNYKYQLVVYDKPQKAETDGPEQEVVDEPLKVEAGGPEQEEVVDETLPIETGDPEQEVIDELQQADVPPILDVSKESSIKEEGNDQKLEKLTTTLAISTNGKVRADKMENETDLITKYKNIIREILENQKSIKMSEMSKIIKEKIGGRNLPVKEIDSIVNEMTDMKSVSIDGSKGIRKARTTGTMGEIF